MSSQNQQSKQNAQNQSRRKRVNRFKGFIIGAAVLLLFFSVILNFILALRVLKLEQKVEHLYSQECMSDYDLNV